MLAWLDGAVSIKAVVVVGTRWEIRECVGGLGGRNVTCGGAGGGGDGGNANGWSRGMRENWKLARTLVCYDGVQMVERDGWRAGAAFWKRRGGAGGR